MLTSTRFIVYSTFPLSARRYTACAILSQKGRGPRGRGPHWQRAAAEASSAESVGSVKQFNDLLRQLYRQCHPDVLRAVRPQYADVNDQSIQVLNGILSTIKEPNSYPPRMVQTIPFYMKRLPSQPAPATAAAGAPAAVAAGASSVGAVDDGFQRVDMRLKTAGGECRRQFTKAMHDFFVASGMMQPGDSFKWSAEYFPLESSD